MNRRQQVRVAQLRKADLAGPRSIDVVIDPGNDLTIKNESQNFIMQTKANSQGTT